LEWLAYVLILIIDTPSRHYALYHVTRSKLSLCSTSSISPYCDRMKIMMFIEKGIILLKI
jgi:hypothetical protein